MRLKIWRFMCGDWWWESLEGKVSDAWLERLSIVAAWLQRPICAVFGHIPERDQCNVPDHDYCICCNKLTPGQAPGRAV